MKNVASLKEFIRPGLTIVIMTTLFLSAQILRPEPADIDNDEIRFTAEDGSFTLREVQELFSQAEELEEKDEDGFFRVLDSEGELLGRLGYGPPADKNITGYAGRVPFLVGLDDQWRVTGVLMLDSQETASFAMRVKEELSDSWNQKLPDEAVEADVDAVSGATQTSNALIRGVEAVLERVVYKPYDPGTQDELLNGQIVLTLLVGWFVIISTAVFFLPFSPTPMVRNLINGLSVLIPGLLASTMLTINLLGQWLQGEFTWSIHWLPAGLAILALLTPLFTGKHYYCYYYCPFGAAQELLGKFKTCRHHPGHLGRSILRAIRATLITLAALTVVFGLALDLSWLEPFTAFQWAAAPLPSVILAAAFLIITVWSPRLWCRICPTGGGLAAMRRRPLRNKDSRLSVTN